ncbi:MAG: hypothetical protein O2781_02065, partial [Bacteroidetes bacterium]|nr:hypothetical protein [Bacteroidota bacterium]
ELTEGRKIQTEGYYDSNGNKVITDTEDEIIAPGFDGLLSLTWTFSSDGTVNEMAVYDSSFTPFSYSYQKNGNTLTISPVGILFTITTLSSSKLSFYCDTVFEYEEEGIFYFEEYYSNWKLDRSSFTSDNSNSKKIKSNKDSFLKTSIDRRKKR